MHAERIANSLFRRPRKSLAGAIPLLRHPRKSLAGIHPRETSSGLTLHLSSCPLSKNPPSSLFVKGEQASAVRLTPSSSRLTPLTASHEGFPIYVILRETKDLAEP
jgi:hypothetical protein